MEKGGKERRGDYLSAKKLVVEVLFYVNKAFINVDDRVHNGEIFFSPCLSLSFSLSLSLSLSLF
jgi:hypothetical protein